MPDVRHAQNGRAGHGLFCSVLVLLLASSCSVYNVTMPNALQSPGTYPAGKGEIGVRSALALPVGGDFKLGLSDHLQIAGIASVQEPHEQVYEGSIVVNAGDADSKSPRIYLATFALGGGVFRGSGVKTGSFTTNNYSGNSIHDDYSISGGTTFLYEGWYPGFQVSEHVGISLPVRMYELFGNYDYSTTATSKSGVTTTTVPLWIKTFAFVPELDCDFGWTHVGLDLGISLPLQFYETSSPVLLLMMPDLSMGLYYKW